MTNTDYLHHHRDFKSLILIVSEEMGIDPVLVEKDYWVMHGLHGMQQAGYQFELKGGTSLSKGYQVIDRFSEDIDIHKFWRPFLSHYGNYRSKRRNHTQKHWQ